MNLAIYLPGTLAFNGCLYKQAWKTSSTTCPYGRLPSAEETVAQLEGALAEVSSAAVVKDFGQGGIRPSSGALILAVRNDAGEKLLADCKIR